MNKIAYVFVIAIFIISCYKNFNVEKTNFFENKSKSLQICDLNKGQYNYISRFSTEQIKDILGRRGGGTPKGRQDTDGDGIKDPNDNCPFIFNPDQADIDGDGIGNACDNLDNRDVDRDGIIDPNDNCPSIFNPDQSDIDNDGIGDICDTIITPNIIYDFTLFLDFDGHYINTRFWNGGIPFYAPASGLSITEINLIVQEVRADFANWAINITTDSTVFLKTHLNKRQRIVITESTFYGSAGGVAYIESMYWGLDIPAFVFSKLLSYNSKYIYEATSHESGHTLGLYHQSVWSDTCSFINEYRHGTIMGVAYQSPNSTWGIGATSLGCLNIQNDTLVISSYIPRKR